jgi:hypothetical protein
MDVAEPDSRAHRFFDEFVEAFESFDGARLAERYASPYLAFHANGRSDVFSSNQDIAKYFQREKGVRSCSYKNLAVVRVGHESAFATVTWKLHAQDGNVLLAWRESYNLWFRGDKCLVFASTDHVE